MAARVVEGYKRGQPDADWWIPQIRAGEQFRKKFAHEEKWHKWRQFYRGNWQGDILPVNLFFMLLRTTVPRVYFKNPSVSITPAKPGIESQVFAQVLERVDNKLLNQMDVKREIKMMIQDGFLFGTAFGKSGFGGFYSPTPIFGDFPETPTDKRGNQVEYRSNIFENMPWFSRVHPKDIIVPDGLDIYKNSRWVANRIVRPVEDVRADPRFKNTSDLRSIMSEPEVTLMGMVQRPISMVELYEIRDKKTGGVMVIAPQKDTNKVLFWGPDDMQLDGHFPIHPLQYNPDDEVFWAVPDAQILEPYQLEINEIRTQIMKHRRTSLVKLLIQRGKMTEEEARKMVDEDILPVVFVDGIPSNVIMKMEAGGVPNDLIQQIDEVMQDVRETVGFSRNAFGEFNPGSSDTTATEAQIVKQSGEIRIDERRDLTADLLKDVIENNHQIIFNYWRPEDVVELVGPGGAAVWVKVANDLLSTGKYNVRVDPDSAIPLSRQAREQKAVQLYGILKENPLIDPQQLTSYLLHEMHGVQFDQMMKSLPAVNGPDRAVSMPEFADMTRASAEQVTQNPAGNDNIVDAIRNAG